MFISSPLILPAATVGDGILIEVTAERGGLAGLILLSTQGPAVTLDVRGPSSSEFTPVTALPRRLEAGETLRLTRTDTSALSSTINAILLPDEGAEPEFPSDPGIPSAYPELQFYSDNYVLLPEFGEDGAPQMQVYAIPITSEIAGAVAALSIEVQERVPNFAGTVQAALLTQWPNDNGDEPLDVVSVDGLNRAASLRLNGLSARTYHLALVGLSAEPTAMIITPQFTETPAPDNNWRQVEFGGRADVHRSPETAVGSSGRRRFVPFEATGAGTLSVDLYSTFSVNSTLQATLHPGPGVTLPGQVDMVTGPTPGWTTINIPIPEAGDYLLNMWPYIAEAQEDNFVYVDLSSLQFTAT